METVNAQIWAFIPAITAIVAVFIMHDVIISLLMGIVVGAGIYMVVAHAGLLEFLTLLFTTIFDSAIGNIPLIVFMLMLASLVSLITMSGGHYAYGRWVEKKIKSARGVSLATIFLGIFIFIDDYFSCLLTGAVMGPTIDKHKISREKLAYLIDSTAAPVCILAPVSSWTMTISQVIEESGIEHGLLTFIHSIPFNYYAIFALTFAFYIAISRKDFSYMKKYERERSDYSTESETLYGTEREINEKTISSKGTVFDLVLPNMCVVGFVLFCIVWQGGFFGADDISLVEAFTGADTMLAMNFGCFGALVFCFFLYVPRRLISFKRFFEGAIEGMKSMFAAIVVLILAWTLSSITTESLGAASYVESVLTGVQTTMNLNVLPLIIFLLSAVIAFGLGSWGTFLITIPFVAIIANATDPSMFYLFLAATLGGAVFGDHASPITDTTILASTGAKCNHIGHVKTQFPYALLICFGSAVSFSIMGFTGSMTLSFIVGAASLVGALLVIYRLEKRHV